MTSMDSIEMRRRPYDRAWHDSMRKITAIEEMIVMRGRREVSPPPLGQTDTHTQSYTVESKLLDSMTGYLLTEPWDEWSRMCRDC